MGLEGLVALDGILRLENESPGYPEQQPELISVFVFFHLFNDLLETPKGFV